MTKIIHCADLHLDSPMETHMTEEQASTRNTEIIHSFLRLTEYAAKNDVRAVILAGDMFDGERVKIRTIDEILDAVRRTPNVDYLYLAGNHDDTTYALADHDIPTNLKLFSKEWATYEYDGVVISGIEICEAMLNDYPHLRNLYTPGDGNTVVVALTNATVRFCSFREPERVVKF